MALVDKLYHRYVSVVIDCPYSGAVDPVKVRGVTKALLEMGCYEVSLGDTVGTGNPTTVSKLLETAMPYLLYYNKFLMSKEQEKVGD